MSFKCIFIIVYSRLSNKRSRFDIAPFVFLLRNQFYCSHTNPNYHLRNFQTTSCLLHKKITDSGSKSPKGIGSDIIVTTDIGKLKESVKTIDVTNCPNEPSQQSPVINDLSQSVAKSQEIDNGQNLSILQRIKKEFLHYYHGFKLFFLELKITCGILYSLTEGNTLTRRERKQLGRTSADLVRMIPFLVFIIVPFMEFLLPLYIKFFPCMMPSTFQENSKKEEKIRQLLKVKLKIANFLQETLAESAVPKIKSRDVNINIQKFSDFLKKVRDSGLTANTTDILRYSQLFEDEITLESLSHRQLKALCKILDLNTMGPSTLLRFQLRMKVRHLKVDDQLIANEGIEKIPIWELQQLCRERGMRAIGVSEDRLLYQLSQWLNLHLHSKVPITLLLLTRIIYLPDTLTPEEKLKQAIRVLPESVSNKAKWNVVTTDEKIDNKTKFDVINEEQKVIVKEREEAKVAAKIVGHEVADSLKHTADKADIIETSAAQSDRAHKLEIPNIVSNSIAPGIKPCDTTAGMTQNMNPEISISDLSQIELAIAKLKGTKEIFQKEPLEVPKVIGEITEKESADHKDLPTKNTAKRLGVKIDKMIDELDHIFDKFEAEKSEIETSEGIASKITVSKNDTVKVSDLKTQLCELDKLPNDNKWQQILSVLDVDSDGLIETYHIIKMRQILSSDNMQLKSIEVSKLLSMIDKEAIVAESKQSGTPPKS